MSDSRKTTWEGFFNTRDLGGLPSRNGGTTRPGAFLRSADPRFVTERGWQAAYAAGVRTVVDLRNPDEIRPAPGEGLTSRAGSAAFPATADQTPLPPGMTRLEVPLDHVEDVGFWKDVNRRRLNGTPLYYRLFLERKAERCAAVITALAQAGPGGVLFHCGAGRDRTGLAALVLLAAARTEPGEIVADYLLSTANLRPLRGLLGLPDQEQAAADVLERAGATAESALLDALAGFEPERSLPSGELAALRARLLD